VRSIQASIIIKVLAFKEKFTELAMQYADGFKNPLK